MRSRVAIAALTVVLLVAAAVASYFLERVEPQATVEVAPPLQPVVVSTPPPPRVAPPPAVAVAVPEVPEAPVVPSAVEEELPGPAQITHLAAASSTALRSACRKAVDACAERFPPWFSASVTIDLDLEQHGEGSRIARAHTAAKSNGPASFRLVCGRRVEQLRRARSPHRVDADDGAVLAVHASTHRLSFGASRA